MNLSASHLNFQHHNNVKQQRSSNGADPSPCSLASFESICRHWHRLGIRFYNDISFVTLLGLLPSQDYSEIAQRPFLVIFSKPKKSSRLKNMAFVRTCIAFDLLYLCSRGVLFLFSILFLDVSLSLRSFKSSFRYLPPSPPKPLPTTPPSTFLGAPTHFSQPKPPPPPPPLTRLF
jgi:hypothetical protein